MITLLDEMIANGTHTSTLEQARLEQVQADTKQAQSRMLIVNSSSTKLNTRQKEELQKHSNLGGTHCFKPYGDSDAPDFSYVTTEKAVV